MYILFISIKRTCDNLNVDTSSLDPRLINSLIVAILLHIKYRPLLWIKVFFLLKLNYFIDSSMSSNIQIEWNRFNTKLQSNVRNIIDIIRYSYYESHKDIFIQELLMEITSNSIVNESLFLFSFQSCLVSEDSILIPFFFQ